MLARPFEHHEALRPAKEIALRSRELARRERRIHLSLPVPDAPAPRRPARRARAWAWARALTA